GLAASKPACYFSLSRYASSTSRSLGGLMRTLTISLSIVVVVAAAAEAEDWPGWRGPRGDGSSLEKNLPLRWSDQDNIAWKTKIAGIGHSSPVVFGDRLFVTTCLLKEQERVLLCLDRRDGKILWQKTVVTATLERKHKLNSFASATPATDGRHVWVTFLRVRERQPGDIYPTQPRDVEYIAKSQVSEMVVACYTVDGELRWQKSPGQFYSKQGFCTTPILYKDTVILNGDQDA